MKNGEQFPNLTKDLTLKIINLKERIMIEFVGLPNDLLLQEYNLVTQSSSEAQKVLKLAIEDKNNEIIRINEEKELVYFHDFLVLFRF